jgi:hypothetical protein
LITIEVGAGKNERKRTQRKTRKRLFIGCLGALAPILVNLYVVDLQTALHNLLPLEATSYAVRLAALCASACIVIYLNGRKPRQNTDSVCRRFASDIFVRSFFRSPDGAERSPGERSKPAPVTPDFAEPVIGPATLGGTRWLHPGYTFAKRT